MSERVTVRVRGQNIGPGDLVVAAWTDQSEGGAGITVGMFAVVDRIQLFDPLTGEVDLQIWLQRADQNPWYPDRDPVMGPVIGPIPRNAFCEITQLDAPACSQEEFDEQVRRMEAPTDAEAIAVEVPLADRLDEDEKMERLHELIDDAIDKIFNVEGVEVGDQTDDERQDLQGILLELVHATPDLV